MYKNKYEINGKEVFVYCKNQFFVIDLEDLELIKQYNWSIEKSGYVHAYIGENKFTTVHRLIMGVIDENITIDHIDRNPRNNRKSNLRKATQQQNTMNRGLQSNNTNRITGVSWSSSRNKWESYIKINGKKKKLGRFDKKEDAIEARLKAEKELFKEFAPQQYLFKKYNI